MSQRSTLKNDTWLISGFTDAAKANPHEPLAAATAKTDPTRRIQALTGVIKSGTVEPTSLLDIVNTLPFLDLSNDLLRNALHQMHVDRQPAWIAQLPPDRRSWAESIRKGR